MTQVPPTSDPRPELRSTSLGEIGVSDEGSADAPALICMHGIPGSTRDFRYLAPLLSSSFRVLRLDMPGFGSTPPSSISTIDDWAAVPGAVAEALEIDRYFLMGHSFGGGAAILAAARDSEATLGLVLLASMGGRLHQGFGLPPRAYRFLAVGLGIPLLRNFLSSWGIRAYEKRQLPKPRDRRELSLQMRIIGSVNFREQGRLAAGLPMPVCSFHALDDRLVESEIARELVATIHDGRVTVFEDGGHHLQKTRAREIANALEKAFEPKHISTR